MKIKCLWGLDLNVEGYEHGYQFFKCGLSKIASLIYTNVTNSFFPYKECIMKRAIKTCSDDQNKTNSGFTNIKLIKFVECIACVYYYFFGQFLLLLTEFHWSPHCYLATFINVLFLNFRFFFKKKSLKHLVTCGSNKNKNDL